MIIPPLVPNLGTRLPSQKSALLTCLILRRYVFKGRENQHTGSRASEGHTSLFCSCSRMNDNGMIEFKSFYEQCATNTSFPDSAPRMSDAVLHLADGVG